jgi:hypothetical protein
MKRANYRLVGLALFSIIAAFGASSCLLPDYSISFEITNVVPNVDQPDNKYVDIAYTVGNYGEKDVEDVVLTLQIRDDVGLTHTAYTSDLSWTALRIGEVRSGSVRIFHGSNNYVVGSAVITSVSFDDADDDSLF